MEKTKRDSLIKQWNEFQDDEGDIDYSELRKSNWQKFEDFLYFNNHELFEQHASKRTGLVKSSKFILTIRIIFVILTTIQAWILPISQNLRSFKDVRFLTHWGSSLSWFTHILGLILHLRTKETQ